MSANIIRRAAAGHDFSIIQRAIMRDERLKADHLGLLCYLLSLPEAWEIRQAQIMKRLDFGREKAQRLFRDLRSFGYMRAERVRDRATGAWLGTRIMVYDAPVVVAENQADHDGDENAPDAETPTVHFDESAENQANEGFPPQPENPPVAAVLPSAPQPEKPTAGKPGCHIDRNKDLDKHISPLNPPSDGDAAFWTDEIQAQWTAFEAAWPFDPLEPRERSRRAFGRLTDADRTAAIAHVGDHLRACRKADRRIGAARSYLAERKFEGWRTGALTHAGEQIFVRCGTPAFDAWEQRWREENNRLPREKLFTIERKIDGQVYRGTLRPTLFPPKRKADEARDRAAADPSSTDPPSPSAAPPG